ncbi:aspartate ammonia-lyase [Rhodobacter sp. 24-YEA-8]|uniref:aspartate ammonia-lyase n=1 Tax=Rhodobacter sp. 24-YEA-8 TaxID=1884310 RepID=UPI00089A823B|nr:aspartate ammonia-lyase [Rhodobacter sp. 24-YEA-8]SED60615.1 aspartate ammonia-lyase [Rhodobacter sp. 24-YEA-8]
MARIETDGLGPRELPDTALYGVNTLRGSENSALGSERIGDHPRFVNGLAAIKKAAAQANRDIGVLQPDLAAAIIAACDELLAGRHHEQFIIDIMEGSGGTSINMNANEVIANRALQILGHEAGDYASLHPNDHVNHGQSTNDVVPSALKLAVYDATLPLVQALNHLADAFAERATAFADVLKIGRTCMQAAQPMTLGQEFGGYASAVRRQAAKIAAASSDLLTLPLGGSAIGTGLGSDPGYPAALYANLSANLGLPLLRADNPFDAMQNSDTFARVSSEIRIAGETIAKIAHDLILISSDPQTGIGEIRLPAVQPGSSIMPGKINPVLPMLVQQLAFALAGNDQSVALASMAGQLEINHFEPVIASRLFESCRLLTNGSRLFADKCISGIEARPERALELLLNSPALATVMVAELGYTQVSAIVKQADKEGVPFVDVMIAKGLMSREGVMDRLRAAVVPVR